MIRFIPDSIGEMTGIQGSHNVLLVLLSYLVAFVAAYTAFRICDRRHEEQESERWGLWMSVSSTILGLGVWSLHFIGMLAHQLPVAVSYDPELTIISVLPAIAGSFYAVSTVSKAQRPGHVRHIAAGTAFGVGVVAMHFTGMEAIHVAGEIYHTPLAVSVSLVAAIAIGIAATYTHTCTTRRESSGEAGHTFLIPAAVFALAIAAMHYSAMAGARFLVSGEAVSHHTGHTLSSPAWIAWTVGGGTMLITLTALSAIAVERRLRRSERMQAMSSEQIVEVIAAIQDGVLLFDENATVLLCNPAFTRITGYGEEELVGHPLRVIEQAGEQSKFEERIQSLISRNSEWEGEIAAQRKSGETFPARLSVSRVNYSDETAKHFVVTLNDISERKESEKRIRHLAYYDSLTGLANRQLLQDRIAESISSSMGAYGALILCDIDDFKSLNDTLGHEKGDELLRRVAERLRRNETTEENLARVSGNEFAIHTRFRDRNDEEAQRTAIGHALSIQASISLPYDLSGYEHRCTVSVGIAIYGNGSPASEELVKYAGMALSYSKKSGGAAVNIFDLGMERAVRERIRLEEQLREAIMEQQFRVYYQPKVDKTGAIIGAEALVRWKHPEYGLIPPNRFIPLAEETGLVVPLGSYVLDEVCEQLARWGEDPRLSKLSVSVNVSGRQIERDDFIARVAKAVAINDIPADRLVLELTESLLMSEVEETIEKMNRLKKLGIGFSLDDFGTGYSSLAYLKRFPFDTLKIDASFVRDALIDTSSANLVRTIIALGRSLQLNVVAEGVETEEQRRFLEENGCLRYQGYLFGRPMTADELETAVSRT